jgi:hypothetical protein
MYQCVVVVLPPSPPPQFSVHQDYSLRIRAVVFNIFIFVHADVIPLQLCSP